VREGELRRARKLVRLEPAQLDKVVARSWFTAPVRRPREAEHDPSVVGLEPEPEKVDRLDLERSLFTDLAPQAVERMLVLVEKPARQIPETFSGVERAASEQHAAALVEADRLRSRHRVRVSHKTAGAALGAIFDLLDSLAANGTEPPPVQSTHEVHHMSPRAAGATQHELSRIGLLATLPGETLARLAQRMTREDVPAGAGIFSEGDDGDRFYVVLSGMLSVSQESRGAQAVLRPGDYFGEVALAMHMPRTASVRALTPATVAWCDAATFDEFIRPLFADDG
jgi:Cyclic nucleotide-binding domain